METNVKRLRKYSGIALGIVLVTAFVLVQPMQASYGQVSDLGAPAFENCEFWLDGQPEDPYTANTIRKGHVALTVIAEKEIFECETVQGDIGVIVDVTTYGEIYENMTTRDIIAKQAFVVTCVKIGDPDGTPTDGTYQVLGCDTYRPLTDFIPVSGCRDILNFNSSDFRDVLEQPQEMNTVFKGDTVKTIEIEKEIVFCDFGSTDSTGGDDIGPVDEDDKKVEQYIIQETWRDLGLLPANTVVEQHVESLRCWTLVTDALVESCQFTTVQLQEVDPFE